MALRQLQLWVPGAEADDIEAYLRDTCRVRNHVRLEAAGGMTVFMLNCTPSRAGVLLNHLESKRVHMLRNSVATLLSVEAAKPPPIEEPGKKKHILRSYGCKRLAIEEIHNHIHDGAVLTFDFVMYVLAAGVIAGAGLSTDSATMVVASMLVSPLMGPILAVIFGSTIRDRELMMMGLRNEIIAVVLTLVMGVAAGLAFAPFGEEFNWPTTEMAARGDLKNLVVGVSFAVASGVVIGVAVTGGGVNSLVGVAISASLLPPIVNTGMCMTYSVVGPMLHDNVSASEYRTIAYRSMWLFALNFALIYIVALFLFRVKAVVPFHKPEFWNEIEHRRKRGLFKALVGLAVAQETSRASPAVSPARAPAAGPPARAGRPATLTTAGPAAQDAVESPLPGPGGPPGGRLPPLAYPERF